jgi:hypothetical protein
VEHLLVKMLPEFGVVQEVRVALAQVLAGGDEVIEQITYLLFLRRLDDLQTLEENKSSGFEIPPDQKAFQTASILLLRLKKPIERRVFPEGKDEIGKGGGRPYEDLRRVGPRVPVPLPGHWCRFLSLRERLAAR